MNKKQVGQVVYILSNQEMSLSPVLIVEELVRRTLNGEEATYFIETITDSGNKKRFQLDTIKFNVFDDIETAKEYLSTNALEAINTLCIKAQRKASMLLDLYGNKNIQENNEENSVQEYDTVLLEDGTRVKIRLKE